jgi:RimJ/RimL family protein N-acetyltransferase
LRKLFAGIYDGNVGSLRAFLKCGFSKVGVLKEHRICGGTYVDELIVERLL